MADRIKVWLERTSSDSVLDDGSGSRHLPAFPARAVDTTGAGDVFHGAFCYAALKEMPVAEALEFSNAMAALNCTAFGARGHVATLEETKDLISTGLRREQAQSG